MKARKALLVYCKPPLYALGAACMVVLVLMALGEKPLLQSCAAFFAGPFSAAYFAGTWLNKASLLAFAALGICISFNGGCFNMGGEGQICISGFATALALDLLKALPAPLALALALLAALLSCGACGLLCGALKAYKGVNEILSSFLLSSAVLPLVDYAVGGPLRGKGGALLATAFIEERFRLKSLLPPSACNASVFAALAACAALFWLVFRTKSGYKLRLCGAAPEFARYCGMSLNATALLSMGGSACMHAFTGFFAVTGTYFTCHQGFYSGMGWNALSVALMAKSNPLAVVPSALLFSYILTATDKAVLQNDLNFNAAFLVQAAVLFAVSAQFVRAQKGAKGIRS